MNLHAKLQEGVQGYKLAFFLGCKFPSANIYLWWRVYSSSETLSLWVRCGLDLVWQLDTKRDKKERDNGGPLGLVFRENFLSFLPAIC